VAQVESVFAGQLVSVGRLISAFRLTAVAGLLLLLPPPPAEVASD